MDIPKTNDRDENPDLNCPFCEPNAKALIGAEEERRLSPQRMKCRKCDFDYWENSATGMNNRRVTHTRGANSYNAE